MSQNQARKGNATRPGNGGLPGWVWFVTGLTSGIFISFLFYLWHSVPTDPNATAIVEKPGMEIPADKQPTKMKWDFYSLFPKSRIPVENDYGKNGQTTVVDKPQHFVLQAGAFKTVARADQRRAQLILLGLQPFVKITIRDGTHWHRVMLGPIDSRLELDRERRKLAEANIPSLSFHVPP